MEEVVETKPVYTMVPGPYNTVRYRKDGKLVAKDAVPLEELARLEEEAARPKPTGKECVFCGVQSKLTRFVNLQTVYLCEEHYYDKSIGKIAHKLQEVAHG